jgi:hypothetical protein
MASVTVIVLDTNIIANCPRLDNATWTSLVEHAQDWGVRIVVPEVVFMETVNVVRRLWRRDRDRLAVLRLGHFRLTDAQSAMVTAIDRQSHEYEDWLAARLDELEIEVQALPAIDPMEIARRASEGRTPFTRSKEGKTKDGYRDTLIWLTLLSVAATNPGETVWLVSENHTDFGPTPGNWTGPGVGNREDCPIRFGDDLTQDLEAQGLSDRVHLVVRADLLEQHLAAEFAPITDSELKALVADIDLTTLAGDLMWGVLGRKVDPDAAALPAGTVAGEIINVHEQQEGWKFIEAARRGDAGWTARFVVDMTVGIELVGAPWLDSEITKVLRVTGRIALSAEGKVAELVIDSVEALPDDPDRARLSRRAESAGRDISHSLNAELLKELTSHFSGPDVAEQFADQKAQLIKDLTSRFSGPSITDALKDQNAELMKDLANRFSSPHMTDAFKDQRAQLIKDLTGRFSTLSMTEMLKDQRAQLMKDLTSRNQGSALDNGDVAKDTDNRGAESPDSTNDTSEAAEDDRPPTDECSITCPTSDEI